MSFEIAYGRFTVVFLGLAIVLPLGLFILPSRTGLDLLSSFLLIAPMIGATIDQAVRFAELEKRGPGLGGAMSISLHLSVAAVAMVCAFLVVRFFISPAEVVGAGLPFLGAILLVAAILFFLIGLLFFAGIARTVARTQQG